MMVEVKKMPLSKVVACKKLLEAGVILLQSRTVYSREREQHT